MTALGSTSPMGTRTGVLAIPPESGASRKLRFGTPVAGGSVGSEEARLHAGLRPPLKLHVRFSRMQLSRRRKTSEMPKKEWKGTLLAPVRLIQSTSLLGRERTGFSLKELFRPPSSLLIWFPFSSRPSSPAAFPDPLPSPVARSRGFHHAS